MTLSIRDATRTNGRPRRGGHNQQYLEYDSSLTVSCARKGF